MLSIPVVMILVVIVMMIMIIMVIIIIIMMIMIVMIIFIKAPKGRLYKAAAGCHLRRVGKKYA